LEGGVFDPRPLSESP